MPLARLLTEALTGHCSSWFDYGRHMHVLSINDFLCRGYSAQLPPDLEVLQPVMVLPKASLHE